MFCHIYVTFTCIVTSQVFVNVWMQWSIALSSAFYRVGFESSSVLTDRILVGVHLLKYLCLRVILAIWNTSDDAKHKFCRKQRFWQKKFKFKNIHESRIFHILRNSHWLCYLENYCNRNCDNFRSFLSSLTTICKAIF